MRVFRPDRVIHDRASRAEGDMNAPAELPGPIPEGANPNWFVLAIRIHRAGQETITIPCIGKKLTRRSKDMQSWVRKLRRHYLGARIELVT